MLLTAGRECAFLPHLMQELMFRHCEFSESNFMLHEQSEENKLSTWGRNCCAKTEFDVVSVVVKFIKMQMIFFVPETFIS